MSQVPEVLFVCVHNAGRSQMAAALLDHHAGGRVVVRSSGSTPAGSIDQAVVEVLAERGLDVSKEFPKPLTTEGVQAADVVVTMGCRDACPVFPGKRYLDWQLDDPAGKADGCPLDLRRDRPPRARPADGTDLYNSLTHFTFPGNNEVACTSPAGTWRMTMRRHIPLPMGWSTAAT